MNKTIQLFLLIALSIILMSGTIDLDKLFNYERQSSPAYITNDNTPSSNIITDEGATLGRVLFYDRKLSTNDKISCSSCHKQEFAFSDTAQYSEGVNGQTLRHSMRLINVRFAEDTLFRWDKTAQSLEDQMIIPIKNFEEMGYSSTNGAPDFQDLIDKLSSTTYYPKLFQAAYGDTDITEERIGKALAQFIRSIQSFDSKYDEGLAQVNDHKDAFPNFSADENAGKMLFTEDYEYVVEEVTIKKFRGEIVATAAHRNGGGLNCASCHRPPEFDIDPKSLNNGFDRPLNGNSLREREFTVTHSPTLRDLVHPNGELNGPMFHAGTTNDLLGGILANYNFKEIHPDNDNLDPRMAPEQYPQYLDMTNQEQKQLIAFLNTLTGKDVYSNEKWSDPFDEMGNITIIGGGTTPISEVDQNKQYVQIFPNPFINHFSINSQLESYRIEILNTLGQHMRFVNMNSNLLSIDMSTLASGIYYVKVINGESELLEIHKIVKK